MPDNPRPGLVGALVSVPRAGREDDEAELGRCGVTDPGSGDGSRGECDRSVRSTKACSRRRSSVWAAGESPSSSSSSRLSMLTLGVTGLRRDEAPLSTGGTGPAKRPVARSLRNTLASLAGSSFEAARVGDPGCGVSSRVEGRRMWRWTGMVTRGTRRGRAQRSGLPGPEGSGGRSPDRSRVDGIALHPNVVEIVQMRRARGKGGGGKSMSRSLQARRERSERLTWAEHDRWHSLPAPDDPDGGRADESTATRATKTQPDQL